MSFCYGLPILLENKFPNDLQHEILALSASFSSELEDHCHASSFNCPRPEASLTIGSLLQATLYRLQYGTITVQYLLHRKHV